jgi:hypothetical protein
MSDLIQVGTAGTPVEGAMMREYLGSHGIDCLVQGEHHRSMISAIGAFIELRLLVPRERAEEASALLRDFSAGNATKEEDQEGAAEDGEDDWRDRAETRRKVRGARMLSLFVPGLGLGHFAVGAWARGLLLAAAWPVAFWLSRRAGAQVFGLIALSTLFDFIATPLAASDVARRRRPAATLPPARARPRVRR